MLENHLGSKLAAPFSGKADAWESLDFRAGDIEGEMLIARKGVTPPPVTYDPHLTGWHKIYLCLFAAGINTTHCLLRLSCDGAPRRFGARNPAVGFWQSNERVEECLWKCCDMTGVTVTMEKPHADDDFGLAWMRFEPMTEEEIEAYKADTSRMRLHAHTDMDWLATDPRTMDEYCQPVEAFAESDAELVTIETYPLLSDYSLYDSVDPRLWEERVAPHRKYQEKQAEILSEYARRAHEKGMRLHVGERMSLSRFVYPNDRLTVSNIPFLEAHPELYCRDRDGEVLPILSYAYPETRDFILSEFGRLMAFGVDGVTLIMHRGVFLLYEQPVADEFARRYPGVDIREVPAADPRLIEVRCSFMTEFMRQLHRRLPGKSVHVVASFSLYDNLLVGLDLETWAREGLVTSIAPSNMQLWEEVDGQYSYDAYVKQKYEGAKAPVRRFHYNHLEKMLCHAPEWLKLGVKIYFELPWENTVTPAEFREYARALYDRGARSFSLWDCFPSRCEYLPEWNVVRRLGHTEELYRPREPARYYRVLRLGGDSLAAYHPSWRG